MFLHLYSSLLYTFFRGCDVFIFLTSSFCRGYDVFTFVFLTFISFFRGCDVFTFIFLTFTFCRRYDVFTFVFLTSTFLNRGYDVFTFVFLASFLFIEDTMCFYICIPHFMEDMMFLHPSLSTCISIVGTCTLCKKQAM